MLELSSTMVCLTIDLNSILLFGYRAHIVKVRSPMDALTVLYITVWHLSPIVTLANLFATNRFRYQKKGVNLMYSVSVRLNSNIL